MTDCLISLSTKKYAIQLISLSGLCGEFAAYLDPEE